MALGSFIKVRYKIPQSDGSQKTVEGVRVGRFSVRQLGVDESRLYHPEEAWGIDHIPTGLVVLRTHTVEEAYRMADDLSRFSARDAASKDLESVRKQLGPKIIAWREAQVSRVSFAQPLQDYREFYGSLSPTGRQR